MEHGEIEAFQQIVEYYRGGKINKFTAEAEISRLINALNAKVLIDDKTNPNGASTYIVMLIPEMINGVYRTTMVLDEKFVLGQQSALLVAELIEHAVGCIPAAVMMLGKFITSKNGAEASKNECIGAYLEIYRETMGTLISDNDPAIKMEINDFHLYDIGPGIDASLALKQGHEETSSIIEYLRVNRVVPELAIQKAVELFNRINGRVGDDSEQAVSEDVVKPAENEFYSKLKRDYKGLIDPEYHKDIDPNYLPKTNE